MGMTNNDRIDFCQPINKYLLGLNIPRGWW